MYIYIYNYIYTFFLGNMFILQIHSLTTWVSLFVFINILSSHQGRLHNLVIT